MNIVMVGISHKTAPIDIRERFYLTETERELLLSTCRSDPSIAEVLVLSTCNRTEIYAHALDGGDASALLSHLFSLKKLKPTSEFNRFFYIYKDTEAVNQLFHVASGLDSIVLGEKQILGQLKSAVELSRRRGALGKCFNVLAGIAIRTGKKAQSETQISSGGASISWAAVTMAHRRLGTFQDKSFLIIGAGKMGYLAANQLCNRGAGQIYVMNRSLENARALADKFGGIPVSFWDIKEVLQKVDVCICSVGAPHYILEKETLEKIMPIRRKTGLLCVDISIPRNIEPSVTEVENVSLITIDDLGDVVAENMEKRYSALNQVEAIIAQKIVQYNRKISKIRTHEETGSVEPAVI